MFTLTFTKVFDGSGVSKKTGKPYKRWDYKTADETRYVHFVPTAQIPLDVPVSIELEGENRITSWSLPEGNQQTGNQSNNGSQAVTEAPVASQGVSVRDLQIHRQTASKVAAELAQTIGFDIGDSKEEFLAGFFGLCDTLVDYYENGVREDAIKF